MMLFFGVKYTAAWEISAPPISQHMSKPAVQARKSEKNHICTRKARSTGHALFRPVCAITLPFRSVNVRFISLKDLYIKTAL